MITISKRDYLTASQVFHWATKEHYVLWFTGKLDRHQRTEVMLNRLVTKGKLRMVQFGKRLAYSVPRISRGQNFNIVHGLACTEGLVRFWRSDMASQIIPEKSFRGSQIIPEWGLRSTSGNLLLYEFCTLDNFTRYNTVKWKIARYKNSLDTAVVLFVVDAPREKLQEYLKKAREDWDYFYFTDYLTFQAVPYGQQYQAPIYIWGGDGKTYPLREHV
jgi:hypothetical protein